MHFEVIENTEDDKLDDEQTTLDKHDDLIAEMNTRVLRLISAAQALNAPTRSSKRKFTRLQRSMEDTRNTIEALPDSGDPALLVQYNEKLIDYKGQLASIHSELIEVDIPDDHDLFRSHSDLEELFFKCSLKIKQLHNLYLPAVHPPSHVSSPSTVRLPKLEVPTFDGNILLWKKFWEQFSVSVHDHTRLSDAEKLVYLQQAIKDSSANSAIEGLSKTGDRYNEAVQCLKARFDRPRLIHREHVRLIMNTTPLRDGSGRELRRLHDAVQQHTRALKTMGSEPESFLTSVIELKLNRDTMFEWQKHTQAQTDTPPYQELLEFIDLRAQASETSQSPSVRKPIHQRMQSLTNSKTIPSFASLSGLKPHSSCILCAKERHPLYHCPKFKPMSHEDRFDILRKHNLCLNCLGSGHFARQCKSDQRCRKCQRPHHTLLHSDTPIKLSPSASEPSSTSTPSPSPKPSSVPSNAAIKLASSPLLMTCKVLVTAPDGLTIEARALLDNASSTSFVTERLVQTLHLPQSHQSIQIMGIAGSSPSTPTQSIASLSVSPTFGERNSINISAIVLPTVTCNLPVSPVPYELSWTHLSDIQLVDPAFGQPGRIDILLGVNVFMHILRHGRRTGPTGSPVALETDFGWVLSGGDAQSSGQVNLLATAFHTSVICNDDILRRFWEIEESVATPVYSQDERTVLHHFEKSFCGWKICSATT